MLLTPGVDPMGLPPRVTCPVPEASREDLAQASLPDAESSPRLPAEYLAAGRVAGAPSESFPGQGQACKAVVGTDHGFVWEYEWLGFGPAPKTGQGWGRIHFLVARPDF